MIKLAVAIGAILFLAGCSSTPEHLQANTERQSQAFSENYQEIYRRVSSTARRCQSGNINAYASYDVDSELYSELGYGEVSLSMTNLGQRNYYWTARIERAAQGSQLTVNAGNTLNSASLAQSVFRWASGDQRC